MAVSSSKQTVSDEKVAAVTGRTRAEWNAVMRDAGAESWKHQQIATWLVDEHRVDPWWAQHLAVGFEQEHGGRRPGQRADGTFEASAGRTVEGAVVAVLERAIVLLSEWAGSEPRTTNLAAKYPTARWDLGDGSRLQAMADPAASGRTRIRLTRSRLGDPESLTAVKVELVTLLDRL